MSGPPPPPPPPHGESPKTTAGGGLPPGKYDIFVIPQHSAGSGFLYLPSLKPNINSFVAGFASALALVVIGQSMAPAFRAWWANFQGMGNMGMLLLLIAVGSGAWVLGRTQQEGGPGGSDSNPGHDRSGPGSSGGQGSRGAYDGARQSHDPPPNAGPPPPQPGPTPGPPPHSAPPPNSAPPPRQRAEPPPQQEAPRPPPQKPQPQTPKPDTKSAWEKAREETRRKEEERKAEEEERKRKEAAAQRLKELREKEARERAQREKDRRDREAREQAEKARKDKELKELREKEQRERDQRAKELRERLDREAKLRAEQERLKKEEEEKNTRKGSTYAFSAVGERTNPWPNSRPPAASRPAAPSAPSASPSATPSAASARSSAPASSPAFARPPPSATASSASGNTARPSPKKPQTPTAKTFTEPEEEMHSFRPYDKPKRPSHKKSVSDFSETSWTPSYSTAQTTPPPSARGPYSTKDPDKIVIKAVYGFPNQFAKTPSSQLIAGIGNVTDGLILHITTEGLFIDDDVRGVPQREWDVKAWTLKLVEVWCPSHVAAIAAAADKVGSKPAPAAPDPKTASFFRRALWQRSGASARDKAKPLAGDEANAYLVDLMAECEDNCRLGLCNFASPAPGVSASASAASSASNTNRSQNQTGGWNAKGLHLLRATLRDQDEKRYLFVLGEEEAWKLALGVQRLIKGGPATMTRSVGVSGMSEKECRSSLEMLGWTQA